MSDSKLISLYIPALTVGGAQRVTITLANTLAANGYEVELVVSFARGELLDEVSDSVTVVDLGTPEILFLGAGASVPALVSYLRRREPAVLLAEMTYTALIALCADSMVTSETAVVGVEHDQYGAKSDPKERLVTTAMRYAYPRASGVVAVSQGVADSVIAETRLDTESVSVIHNPIRVERIRRQSSTGEVPDLFTDHHVEVILSVGRLDEQKDYPTLLRSFTRVATERSNAHLALVGRGPRADALADVASDLGVSDRVHFLGYVPNVYRHMQEADVLVLSSTHEGLPTVLIEALACGTPVVSTDCPFGPREILVDGKYGELVPVGDDEALSNAITRTIENPPAPDYLQARADSFSPNRIVEEYETFFDQL